MDRKKLLEANPISRLQALAATAPQDDEKPATQTTRKDKKSSPRGSQSVDLGPLDVEKYLSHYGVEYQVKPKGSKTLYILTQCLFDPNHKGKDSAIVQGNDGILTYHCFHDTCNHTWHDARSMISGQDKIAQFCQGYDPNFKPAKKTSPLDTGKDKTCPLPPVSPPENVDPLIFFDGKVLRDQFVAKYLHSYLNPIMWDEADFYVYDEKAGVWKKKNTNMIGHYAEKALDKYATNQRIDSVIKLLAKRTIVEEEKRRHDPNFLNLKNGMLEISTGKLYPHEKDRYSRIQLPVEYNKNAECPRWERFLSEVFADDTEKMLALQSFYGYCLLPDCRFQKCLFIIGDGSNGKTVATTMLLRILGDINTTTLSMENMKYKFLLGQLKDKMVNIAGEVETSNPISTATFKAAVVGERMLADRKHGPPFEFEPIAKHIFSMNSPPKVTDRSYGFQRRPVVIRFNQIFKGDKKDIHLLKKLQEELSGIFMWMLDGLQTVLEIESLYIPDIVDRDTKEYIQSTNPLLLFVEECCDLGPEENVSPPELFKKYVNWCTESKHPAYARNNFYHQITSNFPEVTRRQIGSGRERVFVGIGLKF